MSGCPGILSVLKLNMLKETTNKVYKCRNETTFLLFHLNHFNIGFRRFFHSGAKEKTCIWRLIIGYILGCNCQSVLADRASVYGYGTR